MASKTSPNVNALFLATRAEEQKLRKAKQSLSQQYLQTRVQARASAAVTRATAFNLRAATNPAPETNVVGLGLGEKISQGRSTGIPAVKVLVRIKYPESQIPKALLLPKTVQGMPVDVEEVGTFRAALKKPVKPSTKIPDPRVHLRPAQPGASIGFRDPGNAFIMAGTFGLLVKKNGKTFILSNNHVLADEGRLPIGDPIFQPGLLDQGNPATDQIASLSEFVALQAGAANVVDAAIAEILPGMAIRDILVIGPPQGTADAAFDMVVHKFGRTTSYTAGRITSLETDVNVEYETGTFMFSDQILIQGNNGSQFSAAGDSGSAIVERASGKVVGLLFAGSNTHTIANHIGEVFKALSISLA
jgi:hypothetical protein